MSKDILLIVAFLFIGLYNCFANRIIIKTCPLQGERFVTKLPNPDQITNIFKTQLTEKGFEVISSAESELDGKNEEAIILKADIFVFQFLANYPSIKLVIRTGNDIIYSDEESIVLFTDRQLANQSIANEVAKRIPTPDLIKQLNASSDDGSFNKNLFSLIGLTTNSIAEMYINKFQIEFSFDNEANIKFPYSNSIEDYFKNLINFVGYRGKVRGEKIILHFEIDKYGFTKIVKKELPVKLKEKHINRIESISQGIPLWDNLYNEKVSAKLVFWTK